MTPWSERSRQIVVIPVAIVVLVGLVTIAVTTTRHAAHQLDTVKACVAEGNPPLECREATR